MNAAAAADGCSLGSRVVPPGHARVEQPSPELGMKATHDGFSQTGSPSREALTSNAVAWQGSWGPATSMDRVPRSAGSDARSSTSRTSASRTPFHYGPFTSHTASRMRSCEMLSAAATSRIDGFIGRFISRQRRGLEGKEAINNPDLDQACAASRMRCSLFLGGTPASSQADAEPSVLCSAKGNSWATEKMRNW